MLPASQRAHERPSQRMAVSAQSSKVWINAGVEFPLLIVGFVPGPSTQNRECLPKEFRIKCSLNERCKCDAMQGHKVACYGFDGAWSGDDGMTQVRDRLMRCNTTSAGPKAGQV